MREKQLIQQIDASVDVPVGVNSNPVWEPRQRPLGLGGQMAPHWAPSASAQAQDRAARRRGARILA
jgi:hypothetical protein